MYIEDWDTFFLQAQELQRKRPLHTRYCIKYSHKEGKLVLKVTDDVVVSDGVKVPAALTLHVSASPFC